MTNENGELSAENKNRILEAFGFGSYENARDLTPLHVSKASEENIVLREKAVDVDEYDDHGLHINEHIRFLLSAEFRNGKQHADVKKRFTAHIAAHESKRKEK